MVDTAIKGSILTSFADGIQVPRGDFHQNVLG